jgi:hypothetical protein
MGRGSIPGMDRLALTPTKPSSNWVQGDHSPGEKWQICKAERLFSF